MTNFIPTNITHPGNGGAPEVELFVDSWGPTPSDSPSFLLGPALSVPTLNRLFIVCHLVKTVIPWAEWTTQKKREASLRPCPPLSFLGEPKNLWGSLQDHE